MSKRPFVSDPLGEYFERTRMREVKALEKQDNIQKTITGKNYPERKAQQEESKNLIKQTSERILELEESTKRDFDNLVSVLTSEIKLFGLGKTMQKHKKEIDAFKADCLEYKKLKSKTQHQIVITLFDELIGKLAEVNPRALLYGDVETYPQSHSSYVLKLEGKDKKDFQTMLEEHNMFSKDSGLMKVIRKLFPDHIREMNSTEVAYALRLEPSAFNNLTDSQREPYENPVKDVLNRAVLANPALILYLPENLIHQLINKNTRAFLAAILAHPELLDKLSSNFFTRHEAILGKIFAGSRVPATKQKFADALGSRIENFSELKNFFSDCETSHSI